MDDFKKLSDSESESEWLIRMNRISVELGFLRFIFKIKSARSSVGKNKVYVNFEDEWSRLNGDKDKCVDALIDLVCDSSVPMSSWGRNEYIRYDREFFELVKVVGLEWGIVLPLHGAGGEVGVLCLSLDKTRPNLVESFSSASMLRDFALGGALRFFECCLCDARIHLTKRELEILHWGAQGKTSWEISKILGCSEANINFHFSRIRIKLNVSSRAEAIYCAMKTGLLKS